MIKSAVILGLTCSHEVVLHLLSDRPGVCILVRVEHHRARIRGAISGELNIQARRVGLWLTGRWSLASGLQVMNLPKL